jgi:hypothetical protein
MCGPDFQRRCICRIRESGDEHLAAAWRDLAADHESYVVGFGDVAWDLYVNIGVGLDIRKI